MRDAIRSTLWEVAARLDAADVDSATQYFLTLHPADQADILTELSAEERDTLMASLDPEQLAALLEHLTPQERADVTPHLEIGSLAAALDEAPPETAADVLHDLEEEEAAGVLNAMEEASAVEPLLAHEDESAGGIMTPNVIALRPEMTAGGAITYLRTVQPAAADAYYLYVADEGSHLLGVLNIRELITAAPERRLRDLMDPNVISTTTDTDQEEVLQTLQHYNLRAIPVVDEDGRLAGMTTVDDLIDVAQQEATEDMFRMVGLTERESFIGPVVPSVRRRLPWLSLYLGTVFVAAATISAFEGTLTRAPLIAIFLPVVAGLGGNAGTQTLTLVVRAMALGEYDRRHWRRVLPREIAIALLNGAALGLLVALVAGAWQSNVFLGVAIGVAMVGNLVIAGLAGVLVPTTLRLARADPALGSGIVVTAVTDVMGFFFYLGMAALLIDRIAD